MSRIRISGGGWRSRQLKVVDSAGLRPTPDKVRQTLFSWVGQDLSGWACLDLFAGTGVLGLEAASRGAERVTLVEKGAQAFFALRQNLASLGAGNVELHKGDALQFLASHQARYDLIFLDPPYRQGWLQRVAPLLDSVAADDCLIYAEAESSMDALGAWRTCKRGVCGSVHYHLMQRDVL